MAVQPFIKRGTRSNATARRLINTVFIPVSQQQALAASTVQLDSKEIVVLETKYSNLFVAHLFIPANHTFYYIQSNISPNHYYVILYVEAFECWFCSSNDDRVRDMCLKKLQMHKSQCSEIAS